VSERSLRRSSNRLLHHRALRPSEPFRQLADAVIAEEGHRGDSGYTIGKIGYIDCRSKRQAPLRPTRLP
jgi:hypothetical protein